MNMIRPALAFAVVAGGYGLAPLAAAHAAESDTALGTYTFEAEDGESATWTLTPCAEPSDNCVRVAETGSSRRAPWSSNAYWTVGSWILFVDQPDAILCSNGEPSAPGRNNYSWDSVKLTGYASINNTGGACGVEASNIAIPFTLTKTGEPPRMPDAPVYVEPYIVDIPPPYVPPQGAAEAPASAMPAEQDPAIVASPNPIPNESDPLTEGVVAEPGFNAVPGGGGEGARR